MADHKTICWSCMGLGKEYQSTSFGFWVITCRKCFGKGVKG